MTHKRIDVFVKFKSNFHRMISEEQKLVLTFLFFLSSTNLSAFAYLHCESLCMHAYVCVISWVHACLSLCLSEPEG